MFLIFRVILQTSATSKNAVCLQNAPLEASKIKASQRGRLQGAPALRGIETNNQEISEQRRVPLQGEPALRGIETEWSHS